MDKELKTLLVEVARTVLRVLEDKPAGRSTQSVITVPEVPTPWATATNREADKGTPTPAAPVAAGKAQRDDVVRFWDGSKYVVGTVVSLCRTKGGKLPPSVNVRVDRGGGRGKTYKVESAKCELIKGVAR